MTSETYHDSSYDKKGQKRPSRPKLLKLTDVSMPHRNRKKIKIKVKERSQSNVRDRIYDDPAYTDDVSHLAVPLRRSSGPDKIEEGSLSNNKKNSYKDNHFAKRNDSGRYQNDGSSSSDNMPPDPGKHKRGQSLERVGIIERSPKKREKRDRSAKQKRNLSLDNTLSSTLRRSLEKSEISFKTASIERQKPKSKSMQRQNASEGWSSCLAATSDSSKTTENEEHYQNQKEPSKMQIGKKFLKGEIGIKSFNYYLLKEGLKSSKKFVDKDRGSLSKNDSKKPHSRSEENIYEEIFFIDKASDNDDHSKYPDCELCMQQCNKENCEYCLEELKSRQYFGSLGRSSGSHAVSNSIRNDDINIPTTTAHILQYQSYNPNNPGVYKIETTPVAFTSDYNPIQHLQQSGNPKPLPQRRFSRTGSQVDGSRINKKSSSSSDSLHHKYVRDQSSQERYDCNHPLIHTAPQMLGPYDQKIYKSDSKVSIISEYSVRSESSNRNFRCGEVSDSSLGDSMFSYSTQRRYFGSSESCRFAFECRRCSLDGEKCSFSDTCRYECRNCDCSSSYFSSDFDDYSRKNSTGMSNNSQKSYEYYNDNIDIKQNKYAQDFIKHVSDVKRSIYQAELQRGSGPVTSDPYGTIPPPKQMDMKKSMNHYQQTRQYQQRHPRSSGSPFKITPSTLPSLCTPSMIVKDVNVKRDNNNANNNIRMPASQIIDKETSIKILSSHAIDDKGLKYSEGKNGEMTLLHSSDSGKHDIKDSLEHNQKRQTGAIPKLSSSSTNNSHQSHKNYKNSKDIIQKMPATGSSSPRLSPHNLTDKDTIKISTRSIKGEQTATAEVKKLITGTFNKPGEIQRSESKEMSVSQDHCISPKTYLDIKCVVGGDDNKTSAVGGDDDNDDNSQAQDQSRASSNTATKQQRRKSVPRSGPVDKTKLQKPSEWFDYDDGDDDVFFDAKTENMVANQDKRQRSLVLLHASHVCQVKKPNNGDEEIEEKPITDKLRRHVKPPSSSVAGVQKPEHAENLTENSKRHQKASTTKEKETTSALIAITTPKFTASDGAIVISTKAQVSSETTKMQQLSKAQEFAGDSSMKQSVDSAPKQHPQKLDASRGASPSHGKCSSLNQPDIADVNRPQSATNVADKTEVTANSKQLPIAEVAVAEISRKSDVAGATFNSEHTNKHFEHEYKGETTYLDKDQSKLNVIQNTKNEKIKTENDESLSVKIDFSDLPLPELPPKKRRNKERFSSGKFTDNFKKEQRENVTSKERQRNNIPKFSTKRRDSLDSSLKTANDTRKMHYHNQGQMTSATSSSSMKPTYLFGENRLLNTKKHMSTDQIFLNKSGWVQVSSKRVNDENSVNVHIRRENQIQVENKNGNLKNSIRVIHIDNTNKDKPIYAVPKVGSKIEELISRNEARRSSTTRPYMKPGYKIIDPQIASILNERPGFLPVKSFPDNESPPPITPILSPPPAFQDKTKCKNPKEETRALSRLLKLEQKTNKGMVFSRSFEYDTRKPADYAETFSKSFDSNLSDDKILRRDRSPNFSTLTGCSPNYLTKRESSSGRSRDSSPKCQQVGTSYMNIPKQDTPVYSNPKNLEKVNRTSLDRNERSRRAQFSRVNPTSRFRSFDTNVNQRLNSCDSGARSDLSNDEFDNEEDNPSEFLTASYQSQPSSYRQQKQRSLTPDRQNSLGIQKNLRKQRSLTPESRSLTPEDRKKKGSQVSLSSRQNSSSRSNTLERKPKCEENSRSPSRSSSSSSYSGREHEVARQHRRLTVRNAKAPDDHRIRRSRSLQLSERSPNHTVPSHKMVVSSGQSSNQQSYHHPVRNFPPTIRPDQIVSDKSRSFDLDYSNYSNQTVPARFDFDKSRSFDEEYREQNNKIRYGPDVGIIREDRNSLKPNLQRTPIVPRQTSPQNYGTRLCDHELTYDMLRRTLDRSPIMDFSRDYDIPKPLKSRDSVDVNSSDLNFLTERIYDHAIKVRNPAKTESSYSMDRLKARDSLTPESEIQSIKDTLSDERLRVGVADFIYRHPQLQQKQSSAVDRNHQALAGSSTASRGSCTASSCDLWPHCGITNFKSNVNTSVEHRSGSAGSSNKPNILKAASVEDDEGYVIVVNGETDKDYGRSLPIYPGNPVELRTKYNQKSFSLIEVPCYSSVDATSRIKSKPPIYVNTIGRKIATSTVSSAVFLGEREMPITRERNPSTSTSGNFPGSGKLCEKQCRQGSESSGGDKNSRLADVRRKIGIPNKTRPFTKQRSLSLPNVFLQTRSTFQRDDSVRRDSFSSNLSNKLRAVSSPSLSENPSEIVQQTQNRCDASGTIPSEDPYTASQNYAGVLQKFKKTFSQFKNSGKPITAQNTISEIESGKYRFGPLIWRSSKERRKTKYNRHDKCNSGDSGIQIELEHEDVHSQDTPDSIDTSPSSIGIHVRRTNSAKAAISTSSIQSVKFKTLKKVENYEQKLIATPFPTRSLSQPTGLDRIVRADVDESDTDSVSSHPDLHEGHRSIYAEVLYPFTPAGSQELGLEKGLLIEILRKDIGPWWYGRIKHDAVLAKIVAGKQGWFPKEFVRVIPPYFEDSFENGRQFSNGTTLESCDIRMNNTTTILRNSVENPVKVLPSPSQPNPHHIEGFRNNVIKELLETEINYVKLLSSLCLGYLREMRKRIDIFPPDSLNLIFSNLESIWRFQQNFLDALRKGIENHRIAQVFLDQQAGFLVYSNYCNSYPRALMELEVYSGIKEAKCVLENCRSAENLPELPLSAHLLAPIQRICRYPLHLAELVKHTPPRQVLISQLHDSCFNQEIGDCKEILEYALAAMKKVTETVNEGKRHSEHLTRFQASFENFQGPPIAFHSTRFFMQTDATRVSPNLWNNTYTLFLFDHQLIYCKKDILKRNHFIYKGRIFLDNCRILNLRDGKLFGITLKNALRIYCESRNKWFDFCFRSASRKLRFLSTLAVERQFCGSNLFVSELIGEDDDNLSDREYHSDYDTPVNTMDRGMSTDNFTNIYELEKFTELSVKVQKYSDTLPKKSKKSTKDGFEYNTGSLGRRKIGSWFRKAKSTNSTPTQSPTHQTMIIFNSDSSSQSSPALGYKSNKSKIKDPTS